MTRADSPVHADPAARVGSAAEGLHRGPRTRAQRRWLAIAGAAVVIAGAAAATYALGRPAPHGTDPRMPRAFALAQRGEYPRAAGVLEDYLGEHPGDSDALALQLLCSWWDGGVIADAASRAIDARLTPAQRAMVHGLDLITQRRETEAVDYLATAERDHSSSVEIVFALGEAQWHAQQYDAGAATLERAFGLDPRWQMALQHVIAYRLARGEAGRLRPIARVLRERDRAAGAALDCRIAIGERAYDKAAVTAQAALLHDEATAELHLCLSQALVLAGDLDAGERAAQQAFELSPTDTRERGGFVHRAEYLLYRGRLDDYLALVREQPSRQRTLALALWKPSSTLTEVTPPGPGMRMPPLAAATYVLVGHVLGRDEASVYADYPELEVRAFGNGLADERRGDPAAAAAHYREALAVPQQGDVRMLAAHHLARALRATGDTAGAIAACREVIAPRLYQPYRAVLLPDCLAWSDDRKDWQRLVDAWTGSFPHPAVAEARRRLAAE